MKRSDLVVGVALVALGPLGVGSAAVRPLAGSLDPSFGRGGVVTHDLGSIAGIAVQPDRKIVAAGSGFLAARFLPNGSFDPSFGHGGYVEPPQFPYWAIAHAVALQPDGKIVVAGESFQGDDNVLSEFTLVRYNPNGSLDTGFGANGVANTVIPEPSAEPPLNADAYALAILPSGEILAAGSSNWGGIYGSSSFVVAEYRADGSLDPTFGDGGIVQTQFNGQGGLAGIAVQPDGKIVAGGLGGPGQRIALARYEPDGSLDPTFGSGGKVTTDVRLLKLDYGGGQPILAHGKIVVVGETRVNNVTDKWLPVLTRYQASGRLDSTFGKHGFVKVGNQMGGPNAVLAQPDGKIVLAEYSTAQEWSAIVRLLPDGRPDTHFGVRGSVSSGDTILSLALQPDGKILFGGSNPSGRESALSRLIGGNNCVVPGLRGKTLSKAAAALKASYCRRGSVTKRFSSKLGRGLVISTSQRRGARLPDGAKVDLVVSKGKQP